MHHPMVDISKLLNFIIEWSENRSFDIYKNLLSWLDHLSVINLLLQMGVNINDQDKAEKSLLDCRVSRDNQDVIQLLIERRQIKC